MSGPGRGKAGRLFSEEARLESRIARDTRRLEVLRSRAAEPAYSRASAAALVRKRFSRKSYLMFILDTLSSTRGYEIWDEILAFMRKFKLVSGTLRVAALLVSALETGAAFIIAAGILLALSPTFMLLLLAFSLDSLISGKRAEALVSRISKDKKIIFVFPPRGALGDRRYLAHNARTLAKSTVTAAFIVSPYFFSSRGIGGRGAYSSVRREADGVYLIRRQTYFLLRRRLPHIFSDSGTTFIYL